MIRVPEIVSYKTLACGVVAALAGFLAESPWLSPEAQRLASVVQSLAIACMGWFARDAGRSSQDSGIRPERPQ